jgi:hypothetical protein
MKTFVVLNLCLINIKKERSKPTYEEGIFKGNGIGWCCCNMGAF